MGKNVISAASVILMLSVTITANAGELRVGVGEAYLTIQSGIDAAVDGDIVIVSEGIYTGEGNCDFNYIGKAITVRGTNPSNASVVERTVLLNDTQVIKKVEFENDEGRGSVLEGLTFKGVRISAYLSSPTIRNCVIQDGISIGVAVYYGSPLIENCTIKDCLASGIASWYSNAVIRNCHILNNQGGEYGGGIWIRGPGGSVLVDNCLIESNYARCWGGGVGCFDDGDVRITNSVIRGNIAESSGSGIGCREGGSSFVANCIIENNLLNSGAYNVGTIVNCLIAGNAGGVSCGKAINCTIVDNSNGGIYSTGAIINCIIRGNTTDEESLEDQQITLAGNGYVENSCVSGWTGKYGGVGNFGDDPLFINSGEGDYRLQANSPCVDTGKADLDVQSLTDLDGNGRVKDGNGDLVVIVDIGAYEFFSTASGPLIGLLQEEFIFEAMESRLNPVAQTVTIYNGGVGVLNWSASEPCGWLTVAPDSGAVDDSGAESAIVTVDITGMDMGDYNCDIVISDSSAVGGPVTIPVSLHITGPIFSLSSNSFDIYAEQGGVDPNAVTLTIENVGGGDLDWALTADCDWLEATPLSGIVAEEGIEVSMQARLGELPIGVHTCHLTFTDPRSENNPQVATVYLHVRGDTVHVPQHTDSLATAIDLVLDGGTVIVQDGIYTGEDTGTPNGETFSIEAKGITLRSANGPEHCTILKTRLRLNNLIEGEIHIEGFTFQRNDQFIDVQDVNRVIVDNCVMEEAIRAVYSRNSTCEFYNCHIRRIGMYKTGCPGYVTGGLGSAVLIKWSPGEVILDGCVISEVYGDGLDIIAPNTVLSNCIISGCFNHAMVSRTPCRFDNCTIINNLYGLATKNDLAVIENSIFWDNKYDIIPFEFNSLDRPESIIVGNSYIMHGWPGENVYRNDPQITRDGHLLAGSPCIDAGGVVGNSGTDVDGEGRIYNGIIDIGADEFSDQDEDGLGDHWEVSYFGSISAALPGEDDDGDGLTNIEEYIGSLCPRSTYWYVDAARPDDSGDGQSWETAKQTIGAAGCIASPGDIVLVGDGQYSGTIIDGQSVWFKSANGPQHCVLNSRLSLDSTVSSEFKLEGFTIRGTDPDLPVIYTGMQGIPTFENCVIYGGKHGIEIHGAGAIVRNCRISNNTEDGIHMPGDNSYGRLLRVENCNIHDNGGHGILACDSRNVYPLVTIHDCYIHHNEEAGVWSWATFDVDRCRFEGNGACGFGITSPDMVIRNSVITGNCWSTFYLPGLGVSSNKNRPVQRLVIDNCTVAHNLGSGGIGGYANNGYPHEMLVSNSIVWDNRIEDSETGQINVQPNVSYVVQNSNIQGGWEGTGNIDQEPFFAYPGNYPYHCCRNIWESGDYHLTSQSPCINAGDAEYVVDNDVTDADGRPRILYGRLDMGAYEFGSNGDYNTDGVANLVDLAALASLWLNTGCNETNDFCGWMDVLVDGFVGVDDLLNLTDNWLEEINSGLLPVAYWRFNESAGSIAADSSGNSYGGSVLNMEDDDWVAGRHGNALEFDGVDDRVQIYGFKGIREGQSRSVCAWIKTFDTEGEIVSWGPTDIPGGRWVFLTEGSGFLRVEVGGGAIVGSTVVCDGGWHHVAVVLENDGSPNVNEVRLYVDGEEDMPSLNASDREVNTSLGPDVGIGDWGPANRYFEGLIDEVRIYDRALSEVEIGALAE